jgi:hypothetical protein
MKRRRTSLKQRLHQSDPSQEVNTHCLLPLLVPLLQGHLLAATVIPPEAINMVSDTAVKYYESLIVFNMASYSSFTVCIFHYLKYRNNYHLSK